jgi:hypothetical protein
VQLRTSRSVCKLIEKLRVSCTPGLSATDADGLACMPMVLITAADVRIVSSTDKVLLDAGRLVAPIMAGDKLRVEVTVRDIYGTLVTRSSLGLGVLLEQMPIARSKTNSAPFEPPTNSSNSFVLTIPEMWVTEAAEFKCAFPYSFPCFAERRMSACLRMC